MFDGLFCSVYPYNICVAGRSHCACGTRSRFAFYVLSLLLNKESTKENQLKGLMPLRNPQDFSLSLSFGGYQKAFWHLQILRQRIKDPFPAPSRLSSLASLRAALQRASREKHIRCLYVSRRQSPRAAGEGSEIVFVKKLVELGCVADGNSFCFLACVQLSCWRFY